MVVMLYAPPAFKVEDLGLLHDHMDRTGLALLITVGDEGPLVSHLPLLLDRREGSKGVLIGHLARPNPQVHRSRLDLPAVAIFQGPDAYVSPGWYQTKREHGRVVPTWNYAVVHARGTLRLIDDAEWLRDAVGRLTARHEGTFEKPWSVADAPPKFIDGQLKGIVGVELAIEALEGKYKLSQNRSIADQEGVVAGLERRATASERATADLMMERGGLGQVPGDGTSDP
jgi:transcriptional regulator